jgi:hypothetical protein
VHFANYLASAIKKKSQAEAKRKANKSLEPIGRNKLSKTTESVTTTMGSSAGNGSTDGYFLLLVNRNYFHSFIYLNYLFKLFILFYLFIYLFAFEFVILFFRTYF